MSSTVAERTSVSKAATAIQYRQPLRFLRTLTILRIEIRMDPSQVL